ncbi:MAG: putative DNA binding domain-containing protein [Verrucomicrobia bacterium]|nr:putative DNA binding domain-containing protein [Verrucomicrobiota bacterium]
MSNEINPNIITQELIDAAIQTPCESPTLDFKARLDVESKSEWLEVIKDLVAMANSGGGIILFGVNDDGQPNGEPCEEILNYDTAKIGDKIRKYSGVNLSPVSIFPGMRAGQAIAGISVGGSSVPIVFTADGQYTNNHQQEKFAFRQGTVYFRHGTKSEPGTTEDLRQYGAREVEAVRTSWLTRIRQVVEAPLTSSIVVVPKEGVRLDEASETRIRITDDPTVPAHRLADPNLTHPHRQKEVIVHVNTAFGKGVAISAHDILSVRKVYRINTKPEYCYHGNFSSPTYSKVFVDWLIGQFRADAQFFEKAKAAYKAQGSSTKG